jgi:3-hydroxybutyryl-CoA dehydrogenase
VFGLHVHPVLRERPLVEIVRGVETSDATVVSARAVADRLGAHAVVVDDRAGQVLHALLVPYVNDAVKMVEAGYASADDVDAAMKLGCGYPRGPIESLDAMGLDIALAVQRALHHESGEAGLTPAPLLVRLVAAGHLGHLSGRGIREDRAG